MFITTIYILVYIGMGIGAYYILKNRISKQTGLEDFNGCVQFVTVLASISIPNLIIAILQFLLTIIINVLSFL